MNFLRALGAIALLLLSVAASVRAALPSPAAPDAPGALAAKADTGLLKKLASGTATEFFIVMGNQPDLSAAAIHATREQKGRFVYESLKTTAAASQQAVRGWLDSNGVTHRPFWIVNAILVNADARVAAALAERDDIVRLADNPHVRLPAPIAAPGLKATTAVEWGVSRIGAPVLWAAGHTGQGVVVASADTGVDWTHPALRAKYRGWDGTAANHDYNWHDAIHVPNARCVGSSPVPCDDGLHGSHTVGTMVGDDGAGNQVGVAPGARWMACRNMNFGVGSPASYIECFQFFLAPTRVSGADPDPSKAPDVVNNSWSCPPSEGCVDVMVLDAATRSLTAAGITVVASAGNAGAAGCSTVKDPIAIYPSTFTVGATDLNDNIASFSSRGPVVVDGSGRRKPDISAPGVGVRSTIPGAGYSTLQGTSMASPHVVGAVALLLSARPQLRGRPAALQAALEGSAVPRPASNCDGVSIVPNNTYGWGRVDAKAAVDLVTAATLDIDASAPASTYDALSDGLLIVRYLLGLRGDALTRGALNPAAKRTDPADIAAYIAGLGVALDVDGDGKVDALTDGTLILRYLFGLRGATLSDNATSAGATRGTAATIEQYLQTLMP